MSNLRSVIERTVHLRLQRLAPFRPPVQLLAAFVVLSGVSVVARASAVSALATKFQLKALTKSNTPEGILLWNSLVNIFTRAFSTASFRVRIRVTVPFQWQRMFHWSYGKPRSDGTYATPRAEAKYWRVAGRYRRRLYGGNDISYDLPSVSKPSRDVTYIPLVTYYTPRLLPLYRDQSVGNRVSRQADTDVREVRIPPKTFCKWHRMVFQDSRHPTLAQAVVQMKYHSNRDLREIQRIARMVPDEQVFGTKGKKTRKVTRTTRYSEMWKSWLANKGADLVIVFE